MILVVLIAITAWLISLVLPWWSVFIPGLILGGQLGRKEWTSFLSGFAGVGMVWLLQTVYIHWANGGILTTRIAKLFSLPSPLLVILITVLVGGLIGGLTTLTGYLFRKAIL